MNYTYFHDPGHGWLAVPKSELVQLGIADKISNCSYMRGATAYLEEDCDAELFYTAKGWTQNDWNENVGDMYHDPTPIRGYASFKV